MIKQAKAIVSDGRGKYSLQTVEVGLPQSGEVRVKLYASGICHTDWDSIQNWDKTFIVGHEGAGVIESVGDDVVGLAIGDKVILNWAIPCGDCHQCQAGNLHICEVNSPVCGCGLSGHAALASTTLASQPIERSFHLGTMCEYTVVQAAAVVKVNTSQTAMTPNGNANSQVNGISFPAASIIGCGVMTGWGSVVNAAKVEVGSSVCVIGAGGVGLNCIQAAKQSGATTIIAIDINQQRIEQAKEFGATHGIVAHHQDIDFIDVRQAVRELTNGIGADYAFECTAIPALGSAPLALIKNAGTAVQVSGIEQRIDFDCELFEWDKIYINPLYGMCNPKRDFGKILALYEQGAMKLEELVTKTYTLEQAESGFDDLLNGRVAKGVFVIAEDQ
ncbi:alcohol dehydrogenase catalytic domain-containing protein [Psychrosphaera sp. B3R10]|uniref:alcohol dehydrogenase catalytic domain-containing protein n=1 Tax=unclassified Psychrosphaera TaxID=2641570 RepID=UPI001C0A23D4|nr:MULTISPECIES: alcohol dehydrogenase catalytic domain-containing protein [unclassified Psychrosphaera]MBU2880770.1 alcohol dehydrogenase catalytic domain-containing protein [Psychrosphaera sp. I2R16]MBU2991484.1 alcohol dehydrogenase catalytic domain-containing protein [Psychrosphaera sp. B3R10]MDO6719376.1 alcohol dehydrogenase catalytic domain-containing protein [Psychrosphaera sp. 1_MG-2023]